MTGRVVIIGSDATLLDTRRDVLEANGIQAETRLAKDVSPSLQISAGTSLLIACSSLSLDAQRAVVQAAHSANPSLPCLVVEPATGMAAATDGADAVQRAFDGPHRFVSRVRKLI